MKRVLQILGLSTVVACAALSSAGAATYGICRTYCDPGNLNPFFTVTWSATQSQCCGGTVNPCPPGSTPAGSVWQPSGGNWQFCGPFT